VGETLAETRVEVAAQRTTNDRTAAELETRVRRALDIRARFRENPALFLGLGAATVFLVVGGPGRVARTLRRRVRPSNVEQAYDALPKPMQAWVDALAAEVGPKAGQARAALVDEVQRWRQEPLKNRRARKALAKAMVEGPPGPSRTAWRAAETALTLVSAALARKAIEAFITGEAPKRARAAQAAQAPMSRASSPAAGFSTPSTSDR
jgi:hypothetical protein